MFGLIEANHQSHHNYTTFLSIYILTSMSVFCGVTSNSECKVAREVVGGPRGPIVIIVEVIQCKVD
jgi:hypothetical protein